MTGKDYMIAQQPRLKLKVRKERPVETLGIDLES